MKGITSHQWVIIYSCKTTAHVKPCEPKQKGCQRRSWLTMKPKSEMIWQYRAKFCNKRRTNYIQEGLI